MREKIVLKRGLDLHIKGGVSSENIKPITTSKVGIVPDDFTGIVPKLEVKEGDTVAAGQPVMHDKTNECIRIVSPVSGTVCAVVRGDRRKILRVVIEADKSQKSGTKINVDRKSAGSVKDALLQSGLWAMMRQRPYDVVPSVATTPRDIFVTAFDSAPLAPDLAIGLDEKDVAAGVDALKLLTSGDVYVSTRPDFNISLPGTAVQVMVEGAHPAGNAGVQAANIAPVNKGETVWTLDITTLARIGHLMLTGVTDWNTTVAVTGPEIDTPYYASVPVGAEIEPMLKGHLDGAAHHVRIISGNVLTGVAVGPDGFLRFPYRQITVIPEGDDVDEFMGWASMSLDKMSVSRSFPSHFLGRKLFSPDARLHGGRRAMIMSGEYDKVFPMDILPEYLLKAILARDIDKMEALGIYEVAPEDFALCEYVDPSKIEIQKAVREGLDYLRKELD